MGTHFQAITHCLLLLLTIFIAIGTHQIQGRPLKPPTGVSFRESDLGCKRDFNPETLGNSPGVGHHSVRRCGMADVGRSVHYTEGLKNDFRPTVPGHSPGIGHAYPRIASKPNV
ncbi:Precursor of CEP6, partial [Cucurbita argyrosperma subsp. argyrosperma]